MEEKEQSPTSKILNTSCGTILPICCNLPLIVLGFVYASKYPGTSLSVWTYVISSLTCAQTVLSVILNFTTILLVCFTQRTKDDKDTFGIHSWKQLCDVVLQGMLGLAQFGVLIWGIVVVSTCGDEKQTAEPLFIIDIVFLCLGAFNVCLVLCVICVTTCTICGIAMCLALS